MPCALGGGDRASRRGSEPDDDGAQPTAVVAGQAGELQPVQDRAVAGHLVVLVEDVQAEPLVAGPVVHRLERDERQSLVDGHLGQGAVLDGVRPSPQDLSRAHLLEVDGLRLGQEHDVRAAEQVLARGEPLDERGQLLVGEPERLAVAPLEDEVGPQHLVDPVEVQGVEGQTAFVRLARRRHDSKGQGHLRCPIPGPARTGGVLSLREATSVGRSCGRLRPGHSTLRVVASPASCGMID